jgi:hypothetical protein
MPEYEVQARNLDAEHCIVRGYLECAEWCGLADEYRDAFNAAAWPHWSDTALKTAREIVQSFVDLGPFIADEVPECSS